MLDSPDKCRDEEAGETLQRLMGVAISNKQVQRVSEHYGACLESAIEEQIEEGAGDGYNTEQDASEPTYAMADGSMVFTRTEKWKEIKVGRVFKASNNLELTRNRNWIRQSKYCAYLGGHKAFLDRFELLLQGIVNHSVHRRWGPLVLGLGIGLVSTGHPNTGLLSCQGIFV